MVSKHTAHTHIWGTLFTLGTKLQARLQEAGYEVEAYTHTISYIITDLVAWLKHDTGYTIMYPILHTFWVLLEA